MDSETLIATHPNGTVETLHEYIGSPCPRITWEPWSYRVFEGRYWCDHSFVGYVRTSGILNLYPRTYEHWYTIIIEPEETIEFYIIDDTQKNVWKCGKATYLGSGEIDALFRQGYIQQTNWEQKFAIDHPDIQWLIHVFETNKNRWFAY